MSITLQSSSQFVFRSAKELGFLLLILLLAIALNAVLGASETARLDQEKQVCLSHNKTPRVQSRAADYMHGGTGAQVICD